MSTQSNAPAPESVPHWQMPALHKNGRMALGVAAGIAEEIGLDAAWVRIAFITLFALGGWGALLYGAAWLAMTMLAADVPPTHRAPKASHAASRLIGFALVVAGSVVVLAPLTTLSASVIWPIAFFGTGLLLAWRKIDHPDGYTRNGLAQILFGAVLAATGVILLVAWNAGLGSIDTVVVSILGVLTIVVVLSAPWWLRVVRQLDKERQARARSDERAVVAAHLHDSVLQTLTLIQKNEDPAAMAQLARRQERELRNWLDPDRVSRSGLSIRGYLDNIASDVEELHGAVVQVVVVGDCLVDEPIDSLLAAAREAAVNAAKHSGATEIDIFVEIGTEKIDVFVRDKGFGFDLAAVSGDRQGIRGSIQGRMERVGGTALIDSVIGEGTEVELSLPLHNPPSDSNPTRPEPTSTQQEGSQP